MKIQKMCDDLNSLIHDKFFLNIYLCKKLNDYERTFTSLDLIGDCQNAIEEFDSIPIGSFQSRTTLYIYGVLQSLYCQQDGLYHLYKTINSQNIKLNDFFKLYDFNKEIREVRDDIAGHPTDRKSGKEFYYIVKGSNSKYSFSYAGYNPDFKNVDVDLKAFILEQSVFTAKVLNDIKKAISEKIQVHKNRFNKMKLISIIANINLPTKQIMRGIFEDYPFSMKGLNDVVIELVSLKQKLNLRYGDKIPESIKNIFRLQDHILEKMKKWISNNELTNNVDAEIFMDSFDSQMKMLSEILKEIDDEF